MRNMTVGRMKRKLAGLDDDTPLSIRSTAPDGSPLFSTVSVEVLSTVADGTTVVLSRKKGRPSSERPALARPRASRPAQTLATA